MSSRPPPPTADLSRSSPSTGGPGVPVVAAPTVAPLGADWPRRAVDFLFFLGMAGMLGIFALVGVELADSEVVPRWAVLLGALAAAVPVLVLTPGRRDRPYAFLVAVCLAAAVLSSLGTPIPLFLLVPVGIFVVEAYAPEGWQRTWVPPVMAGCLVWLSMTETQGQIAAVGAVAIVSIIGWARGVRAQRRYRATLLERLRAAERERDLRAEQAVAAERNRIARDIHDLVSHSLAVVAVQAAGAERIAEKDPARAREALAVIGRTSRNALTEMRAMLDVLRQGPDGSNAEPAPGLAQIPDLADAMTGHGIEVRYQQTGQPHRLAPGAELALYRVAQESLTNAAKHGLASAGIDVWLSYESDRVLLEVRNRLASPGQEGAQVPGAGTGQAGMRQRLALYSGDLTATAEPEHYCLRAWIPHGRSGGGQGT